MWILKENGKRIIGGRFALRPRGAGGAQGQSAFNRRKNSDPVRWSACLVATAMMLQVPPRILTVPLRAMLAGRDLLK